MYVTYIAHGFAIRASQCSKKITWPGAGAMEQRPPDEKNFVCGMVGMPLAPMCIYI